MLSSLQDFRPGQEGNRETPWQATLGYAARVHVSQPEFATEQDELPRNFWRGNVNIPRVAQCRETVVAFYGPTTRVGLGFTHAYFPQFAFDEVFISNRWAFARKNEGYLALYADNGLQAVKNGMGVGRALRSPGQENVWVCSLSRQAWDGDFDAFKGRVPTIREGVRKTGPCDSSQWRNVDFRPTRSSVCCRQAGFAKKRNAL